MKNADWKAESAKAHAAYMTVYNNQASTDADKYAAFTVYHAAMNEVGKMVRCGVAPMKVTALPMEA